MSLNLGLGALGPRPNRSVAGRAQLVAAHADRAFSECQGIDDVAFPDSASRWLLATSAIGRKELKVPAATLRFHHLRTSNPNQHFVAVALTRRHQVASVAAQPESPCLQASRPLGKSCA